MARFGGLPGGGGGMPGFGDIQKLMKQAQKMQDDAAKLQEELKTLKITASSGGGMVTVTVNGHGHLTDVHIDPSVMEGPDDVEMVQDLIVTAAKEASAKAEASQAERMEGITGELKDLNLPPGLLG